MKILANGGLNVSILDGWWDEAFDCESGTPPPGWIVGSRDSGSPEQLNACDTTSLFDMLEHQVIPEFYDRDPDGIPHRWICRVKASMAGLTPQFSADGSIAGKCIAGTDRTVQLLDRRQQDLPLDATSPY